jgi:hypothetical protein
MGEGEKPKMTTIVYFKTLSTALSGANGRQSRKNPTHVADVGWNLQSQEKQMRYQNLPPVMILLDGEDSY